MNPAGTIAVSPGSAASVCYDLIGGGGDSEIADLARRLRGASSVAIVWSGDDHDHGRRGAALAASLELGEGSGLYILPRTPNGRGVAQAWHETGNGDETEIPEGEIGALIISGDGAADDPRVAELAERARFVLVTTMFPGDHTLWAHVVVPGTAYLERDGTSVNLEGRQQRMRQAIDPAFPDELEFFARVGAALGVPIPPWAADAAPAQRAELPPRASLEDAPELAPLDKPSTGKGFELATYRSLFSGREVERTEPLAFQRPPAEVELLEGRRREAQGLHRRDRRRGSQRDKPGAAGADQPAAEGRRRAHRGRARSGPGQTASR